MSRLDDANEDLNLSMGELSGEVSAPPKIARAFVRVLGSIAVTLAMILDRMDEARFGPGGRA